MLLFYRLVYRDLITNPRIYIALALVYIIIWRMAQTSR